MRFLAFLLTGSLALLGSTWAVGGLSLESICSNVGKCMDGNTTAPPEILTAKTECFLEMQKEKTAEKKDRKSGLTCLEVCTWKKLGIFDDSGVYNKARNEELIDKMYPDSALKPLKDEIDLCVKETADLSLKGTDSRCRNFKRLVHCVGRAGMKVCSKDFKAQEDFWEYDGC